MKNVNICNENLAYSSKLPINDVTDIDIDIVMSNLEVASYDENEMLVEFYFDNPSYLARFRIEVQQKGSKINVVLDKAHLFFDLFSFVSVSARVFIPKTYSNKISIEGAALNIDIHDFYNLDSLKISTASGNSQINNVRSNNAKLTFVSGTVQINEFYNDHMIVESTSGGLLLENIHLKNPDAQNSSIKIEAVSGKTMLSVVDFFDKINISAVSGSVLLAVPCDYKFASKCSNVSGKTRTAVANNPPAQVNTSRIGEVSLSAVSGSLTISQ